VNACRTSDNFVNAYHTSDNFIGGVFIYISHCCKYVYIPQLPTTTCFQQPDNEPFEEMELVSTTNDERSHGGVDVDVSNVSVVETSNTSTNVDPELIPRSAVASKVQHEETKRVPSGRLRRLTTRGSRRSQKLEVDGDQTDSGDVAAAASAQPVSLNLLGFVCLSVRSYPFTSND
jgi:hypothetical protein